VSIKKEMDKTDTTPNQLVPYKGKKHDIAISKEQECWRCFIVLRGDGEVYQNHCPRCACKLSDEPIDVGREMTEDEMETRKMWKEVADLCLIYKNWSDAQIRYMGETGEPDYSCVEDFCVDVVLHSALYIKRLRQMPHFNADMNSFIAFKLNRATERILEKCIEYEEAMKLEGKWNDKEQGFKEYWLKQIGFPGVAITAPTTKRIESENSKKDK
jgi:hypothetical protein